MLTSDIEQNRTRLYGEDIDYGRDDLLRQAAERGVIFVDDAFPGFMFKRFGRRMAIIS